MKFAALVLAGAALLLGAGPAPGPAEVAMKSLGYEPKQIEVVAGQAVVWKNTALTEHAAKSDDETPGFDTGRIAPGTTSKPVLFAKAGTYKYHCSLHGKTMAGSVLVKAATP